MGKALSRYLRWRVVKTSDEGISPCVRQCLRRRLPGAAQVAAGGPRLERRLLRTAVHPRLRCSFDRGDSAAASVPPSVVPISPEQGRQMATCPVTPSPPFRIAHPPVPAGPTASTPVQNSPPFRAFSRQGGGFSLPPRPRTPESRGLAARSDAYVQVYALDLPASVRKRCPVFTRETSQWRKDERSPPARSMP